MNTLRPPSAEAGHQKSINRFLKSIKGLYRVIRVIRAKKSPLLFYRFPPKAKIGKFITYAK